MRKAKLTAPPESEPRAEHPHRCTAGHRWQHDGPAATTCRLPIYDAVSGDLPFVGPEECPVCSGRDDLLVRQRHTHYCNICDGDWAHEGYCLDSLAAWCPWCFPKPDAPPIPGARSGPHFHVCAECGQNWRHETGCGEGLRAALSECPWCQSGGVPIEADPVGAGGADADTVEVDATDAEAAQVGAVGIGAARVGYFGARDVAAKPSLREPSPAIPSVAAARAAGLARPRGAGRRTRPVARAIGVAALLLLPIGIVIVLRSHLAFNSPSEVDHAPPLEERVPAPSPQPPPPAPVAPTPVPPPAPAPESSKPPAEIAPPATRTPPHDVASVPPAPRPPVATKAPSRAPAADRIVEPQTQ